ncbi:hypothetical protein [Pseudarthrobacter sulfonivorans]|uniref:hypothetical protein n=1 Tax=Pseudarthrobacter sulfonivorans TaxID=121292 RepID=UPI0021078FA8|nr:hypothetical protein [Pseudarthrobacter sulfonivorans]
MTHGDLPSGVPHDFASDPAMAALVIRTWTEPDQAQGFRARLTYSEAPDEEPRTVSTADPDEVLRLVRQWLNARSGPPHGL